MSRAPFRCDLRVFGSRPDGYAIVIRFADTLGEPARLAIADAFETFISRSRIAQDLDTPWLWTLCGSHHEAHVCLCVAASPTDPDGPFLFATDVENLVAQLHRLCPITEVVSTSLSLQEGEIDCAFEDARSRARSAALSAFCHLKSPKEPHKPALLRLHNLTIPQDISPPKHIRDQLPAVHWAARTRCGSLVVQGWTANCEGNALFVYENDHAQPSQSECFSRAADHIRFQLHPDNSKAIIADLEQVYEVDIPSGVTRPLLVASEAPDYYPVGTHELLLSYTGACYAGDGQILVVTSRDLRLMDLRGEFPVVIAKAKCTGGCNVAASDSGRFAVVECPKNVSRIFQIESSSIIEIGKLGHCSCPVANGSSLYTRFRNTLYRFENLEQAALAATRRKKRAKSVNIPESFDRLRWS
jgi:hypothetical protein